NGPAAFGENSGGNRATRTALRPGGGQQQTRYLWGVSRAAGSGLDSNELVAAVQHPDPASGAAGAAQQESSTVNALGQVLTATDRNGSVHTYTYNALGRLVADAVTTLGGGVDGAVRRLETAYDAQGNAALFTSYDAA